MRTQDTKSSVLQVAVGNVTALSEVTYEYGVKSKVKPTVEPQLPAPEVGPVLAQGSSDNKNTLPFYGAEEIEFQYIKGLNARSITPIKA